MKALEVAPPRAHHVVGDAPVGQTYASAALGVDPRFGRRGARQVRSVRRGSIPILYGGTRGGSILCGGAREGSAGMDEQPVARCARPHERNLHARVPVLVIRAERQRALAVDRDHLHRSRRVAAGDTALRGDALGHSIALAFSSSSSCSYSTPISPSSRSVARASCSSILESANPTWISTQSPRSAEVPSTSSRPMFTVRRTPATSTVASLFCSSTTSSTSPGI